jgi:hypothetical protein
MNPLYPEISERAQRRCEYCHAPAEAFNFPFEVEHITPLSATGDDTPDNLALACRSCNAFKSMRQRATDPETGVTVPLFHPRRDRWEDHFAPDAEALLLIGMTPVGRATIVALHLNSTEQQIARRQWKRLALVP